MKTFIGFAAGVILSAFFMCMHDAMPVHTRYTKSGVAEAYSTIITDDGHVWSYTHGINAPVKVQVEFDDNGTESIYDDIIIKIY